MWSATAKIPSRFGMLVYKELTTKVTRSALSGICPSCCNLLIKC